MLIRAVPPSRPSGASRSVCSRLLAKKLLPSTRERLRLANGATVFKFAKLSGIADCAVGLARVAVESGQPARAAQLIGFAEATRVALITQDEFVAPSKREAYDSLLVSLPEQLSPAQFEAARAAGRALSLDHGIAYALGDDAPVT